MTERAEGARKRRGLQTMIGAGVAVAVVIAAVVLAVVFASKDKKTNPASPSPSGSASPTLCTWKPKADPSASPPAQLPAGIKNVGTPPATGAERKGSQTTTITGNVGTVTVQIDTADPPCTRTSFTYLPSKKFFDN